MRKYLFMLAAVMLLAASANSQYYNQKTAEKLSKKEQRMLRKEENRKAFELNKAIGKNLIENRDFVLQADRLSSKTGPIVAVSRQTNFIMINGEDMVIQYGLNNAQIGLNGVGGITLEGKIKNFEAKDRGEGKPFMVNVQFYTPYLNGIATVQINVKGNRADATLMTQGRQLNFEGGFASQEQSGVALAKTRGAFN